MKHLALCLICGVALANEASVPGSASPATQVPQATMISSKEIHAVVERNNTGAFSDSVLRVVPIESQYNVGVAVIRRSRVDGKTPPDAVVHDAITEVYQIIEGKGVLITGGTIESPAPLPSEGAIVRQAIGPSSVGKVIRGGTRHNVGPGDVIVIPPHTVHGFIEISTERITYTVLRVDSRRLLETRDRAE